MSKGDFYVVDGAFFKCSFGSAPCPIMVQSNQKVYAQNKALVTTDETTFQVPTAPFVTCSMNVTAQGTPCIYSKGQWNTATCEPNGNKYIVTENSIMTCPHFPGQIDNVFHGQIVSLSPNFFNQFEIEASTAMAFRLPQKNIKIEEKAKCANVNSIRIKINKKTGDTPEQIELKDGADIHKDTTLTMCAFSDYYAKKAADTLVNWVVFQTETLYYEKYKENKKDKVYKFRRIEADNQKDAQKKAKTITTCKRIKNVHIYPKVTPTFNIVLKNEGKYFIEGIGGETTLDKYKGIIAYNNEFEKNMDTMPYDDNKYQVSSSKSCRQSINVLEKNSIEDIIVTGDYIKKNTKKKDEKDPDYNKEEADYFVIRNCNANFKVKTKLPLAEETSYLTCYNNTFPYNNFGDRKSNDSFTVLIDSFSKNLSYKVDLHDIYKKRTASSVLFNNYYELNGVDSKLSDSRTIKMCLVNNFIAVDKIIQIGSVEKEVGTFTRPNGTIVFRLVSGVNVKLTEEDVKNVLWVNDKGEKVKGNLIYQYNVSKLSDGDSFEVSVNIEGTNLVMQNNDNFFVWKNKCEIKTNRVEVIRAKSVMYKGLTYNIKFDCLYKDSDLIDGFIRLSGYDVDPATSKELSFSERDTTVKISQPGDYELSAQFVPSKHDPAKLKVKVIDATIEDWYWTDSKGCAIKMVSPQSKCTLTISIPAWNEADPKLLDKIKLYLQNGDKILVTDQFDNAKFQNGILMADIDFSKVDCSNEDNKKFWGSDKEIMVSAMLAIPEIPCPVIGLNPIKNDVCWYLNSKEKKLTITKKKSIYGYFIASGMNPQKSILSYGQTAKIALYIHGYSDKEREKLSVELIENRRGSKQRFDNTIWDTTVPNPNDDGRVEIEIPGNIITEEGHADLPASRPRLFYFLVYNNKGEDAGYVYGYPLMTINDETFAELSNSKDLKLTANYFWQLKYAKEDTDKSNSILATFAYSVVGEELTKGESFCQGRNCITMANYKTKNAGALIKEINIRLAGFAKGGLPLPSESFTARTKNAIKQFQRDVMGVEPTGRIYGSLLKAIDEFCTDPNYDIKFDEMHCDCEKCNSQKAFGSEAKKGKVDGYYVTKGMHKSLLFIFKAALFYLKKSNDYIDANNLQTKFRKYKFAHISSGYRCIYDNKEHRRTSQNHMGNAIDVQFSVTGPNLIVKKEDYNGVIITSKSSKISETNALLCMNEIRKNIFIEQMGAIYNWASESQISLEEGGGGNGHNANTWVHFDVRTFPIQYRNLDMYIDNANDLCPQKLVDMAKSIGLNPLCQCTSKEESDYQYIANLVRLEMGARKPIGELSLSQSGRTFIMSFEKLRREIYNDNFGYATVGYGHLIRRVSKDKLTSDEIKMWNNISIENAEKYLSEDIKKTENGVKKSIISPLYQYEYDALVSLCYNCGPSFLDTGGANKGDTKIKKFINEEMYENGADEFGDVTNHGVSGLVERRNKEIEMFKNNVYENH